MAELGIVNFEAIFKWFEHDYNFNDIKVKEKK